MPHNYCPSRNVVLALSGEFNMNNKNNYKIRYNYDCMSINITISKLLLGLV